MTDLRVDWCDYKAAKYAVEKWHYSRTLPAGKNVYLGVWEDGRYIGAVVFGTGVAPYACQAYGIGQQEICELVRVALHEHKASVSAIVARCLALLKRQSPGLRLITSYADPEQGHHGGIYQAGNWVYVGTIRAEWFEDAQTGQRINTKTLKTGRRGYATELKARGVIRSVYLTKHKYLYPLDRKMRRQIEPLRKPYPKRVSCGPSVESDTTGDQPAGVGATPAGRSEVIDAAG